MLEASFDHTHYHVLPYISFYSSIAYTETEINCSLCAKFSTTSLFKIRFFFILFIVLLFFLFIFTIAISQICFTVKPTSFLQIHSVLKPFIDNENTIVALVYLLCFKLNSANEKKKKWNTFIALFVVLSMPTMACS